MPYQSDIPKASVIFMRAVYPIFYGISCLPCSVLYALSDFVSLLLYRVFKYRLKVVRSNLDSAFPEKSTSEKRQIERDYYKHLGDIFVEIIKGLSISEQELKKRVVYENPEILRKYTENNQACVVVLTHSGNWEWVALASQLYVDQIVLIVYKSLSNPNFNYLMYRMRSRFKGTPVNMNETVRAVSTLTAQGEAFIAALIGDQSPANLNGVHWEPFFNQETPFLNGPAKIAKKYKLPVLYLTQHQVKRGYYTAKFTDTLDSESMSSEEIMSVCIRNMQQEIQNQPHTWLWSHRRWKHKKSAINS